MHPRKIKTFGILVFLIVLAVSMTGCFGDDGAFTPEYDLTIRTRGEGTTTPSPGTRTYTENTTITVEAHSGEYSDFSHWDGGVRSNASRRTSVIMDRDRTITAVFDDYNTYTGSYYSIRYPGDWYREYQDGDLELTPDYQGLFMVVRESIGYPITDNEFRIAMDEVEQEYRYDPDVHVEQSHYTSVDGQLAHSMVLVMYEEGYYYSLENENLNIEKQMLPEIDKLEADNVIQSTSAVKMKMVSTYKHDQLFMLAYAHEEGLYNNYIDEADKIISSFEFRF